VSSWASLADRQLAAVRADPANRGRTANVGLWRSSRRPDDFLEWPVCAGLALAALPAPFGVLGLRAPVLLLVLILFLTAIPPGERQALRAGGEDDRRYQRQTSLSVPWLPRP
jgi:steroid 5-alpha reductase family enzyme